MSEGLENNEEIVHDLGSTEEEIDLDKLQREMEAMPEGPEKDAIAEKIRTHLGEIESE